MRMSRAVVVIALLVVSSCEEAGQVYPHLGTNTWVGPPNGAYHGNCSQYWDKSECPTAGWNVVLPPHSTVTFGTTDPEDTRFSEGDTLTIKGNSVMTIKSGTFILGGEQMTASPTLSPTASPTASPTESPTYAASVDITFTLQDTTLAEFNSAKSAYEQSFASALDVDVSQISLAVSESGSRRLAVGISVVATVQIDSVAESDRITAEVQEASTFVDTLVVALENNGVVLSTSQFVDLGSATEVAAGVPTGTPTASPTATPTPVPTVRPTAYPTPAPTQHICDTDHNRCDKTEGGVCYASTKQHYDIATIDDGDRDLEWAKEAGERVHHTVHGVEDKTKSAVHWYKCGCKHGYNCVHGCKPPYTDHRCEMTKYPTPYPTTTPTPAPTPVCPVTCEEDKGQWGPGGAKEHQVTGHKRFHALGTFHHTKEELANCKATSKHIKSVPGSTGCDWKGKRNRRVVATHNTLQINTADSFTNHRCFKYHDRCVCECLDDFPTFPGAFPADRFQKGTREGNDAMGGGADAIPLDEKYKLGARRGETTNGHKGHMAGQEIFAATQSRFYKAPAHSLTPGVLKVRKHYASSSASWGGIPKPRAGDTVVAPTPAPTPKMPLSRWHPFPNLTPHSDCANSKYVRRAGWPNTYFGLPCKGPGHCPPVPVKDCYNKCTEDDQAFGFYVGIFSDAHLGCWCYTKNIDHPVYHDAPQKFEGDSATFASLHNDGYKGRAYFKMAPSCPSSFGFISNEP